MIYTFGDGFAAGHIWPEWPQLLGAITPVTNFGHIGAGNEYIYDCAVKTALTAGSDDIFLIQWAQADRFDKIIEDNQWTELHQTDPVYKDIVATAYGQTWWSTSESSLPDIVKYKQYYVQSQQAINRSVMYMITLSKLLTLQGIRHLYFSTYSFDYSTHGNYEDLKNLPWIDFAKGMEEWSKQNIQRGTEIQPSPIVHLDYIKEKLAPQLDITNEVELVYLLIANKKFVAFDPDREHIWNSLKNEINLLFK